MNAYLPRVAEQLRDCAEHVTTGSAYEEKWLVEGVRTSAGDQRPMESMVLNDERFNAYWCRRGLGAANPHGFPMVTFPDEPPVDPGLEPGCRNGFRTRGPLAAPRAGW